MKDPDSTKDSPSTRIMVRGTVTIDTRVCKGCELCIVACPPRVLVMSHDVNELGYRYPRLLAGCTGCLACLQVCPDFVFDVYKYDRPIEVEVAAGSEGSGPEPTHDTEAVMPR